MNEQNPPLQTNLNYMSATEIARRVASKLLSSVDVVEASLNRIEQINADINCFCFTYPEEAREKARAIERKLANGEALGPLAGVPFAIKDFTPTKGKITTRGSILLRDWVPDYDSVLVERLLAADAILVGKTTTPEFAASGFTKSRLWGVTGNPWNSSHSTGGSSGGSAAAVASGCVPIAEGTDMGGSVRIPAADCGIVGFKPSLGRLPMDIIGTVYDNISHFGPLTRTIDDAALFMNATQGVTPRDLQTIDCETIPTPVQKDVKGLKIALSKDLGFYAVHPKIQENTNKVAEALSHAGAHVEEIDIGWDKRLHDLWRLNWQVYLAAAFKSHFGDRFEDLRDQIDPHLASRIDAGLSIDAVTARMWEFERTQYWYKLAAVFEDYHALLCPTTTIPTPLNSMDDTDFGQVDAEGKYHGIDMTTVFNCFSQCPALSVPSGFADGLPTGAQIVVRKYEDQLALRIGAAVEAAMPWAERHPPI